VFHPHLSPPHIMCYTTDLAARYHTLSPKLGASSPIRHVTGLRVKVILFMSIWKLVACFSFWLLSWNWNHTLSDFSKPVHHKQWMHHIPLRSVTLIFKHFFMWWKRNLRKKLFMTVCHWLYLCIKFNAAFLKQCGELNLKSKLLDCNRT
jgi:hypothetical protein